MSHSTPPSDDGRRFRRALFIAGSFVALLWLVYFAAMIFDIALAHYGIYPRRLSGAGGIALAPLLHGSFAHLFANSVPLLILGTVLFYGYPRSAWIVIDGLYFGTGLGVWLSARNAYHIGASGMTVGMMFFVFIIGVLRWDRRAMALSMLVFFLYGSMVWSIFPNDPGVSYESHFYGALIGVVLAITCRKRDPALEEKRYSWEGEEETSAEEPAADSEQAGSRPLH